MAVLTLAQYAQNERQPLKKGIYYGLAREGVVADIFSWRSTEGALSETGVRYDEVIEPDWVDLGGSIASKTANGKPVSFSVHQMAVHLDIPTPLHMLTANKVAKDQVTQSKLAIKGAAYSLNDAFINGDHAANAKSMEGLNKMVADLGSGQTIGATEIDVSDFGTEDERNQVIDRLLMAHDQVDGGKPTHGFCNRKFAQIFRGIAWRNKMLGDHHDWVNNTFGFKDVRKSFNTASTKPAFIFDGVPYYVIGTKADQSTQIIKNDYAEGSSGGATRVFLVKVDEENVEGLQAMPLDVQEIGPLEDTDVHRWRLKWMPGLAVWGPQSIVKVQGIKVA